jgi:hypothetical protein
VGAAGHVFFVDGNAGDDANPPDDASRPLLKIATALGFCVAGHDDTIIVLDCWQQETFPITVTKDRVHIIGLDVDNGHYPMMQAPTDTAIFVIDAGSVEVAGFGLDGISSASTHGAIEIGKTTPRMGGRIHDNWLGCTGAGAKYGIHSITGIDMSDFVIDHNVFGAGLVTNGMLISGSFTRGKILNNLFRIATGSQGIKAAHLALGFILSNSFSCPTNTTGIAITLDAGCEDPFVDDNRANFGKTVMANNPYVDTGALGNWGVNYKGNTLVLPA